MTDPAQAIEIPDIWYLPYTQGWSVIPLEKHGKKPRISWEQFKSAPASLEAIARWAKADGNVGIVTGAVSGIVVLDLDNDEAIAEAKRRGLPDDTVVICPLWSGPISILEMAMKEEWNGEEAQAGRYYREAA